MKQKELKASTVELFFPFVDEKLFYFNPTLCERKAPELIGKTLLRKLQTFLEAFPNIYSADIFARSREQQQQHRVSARGAPSGCIVYAETYDNQLGTTRIPRAGKLKKKLKNKKASKLVSTKIMQKYFPRQNVKFVFALLK